MSEGFVRTFEYLHLGKQGCQFGKGSKYAINSTLAIITRIMPL